MELLKIENLMKIYGNDTNKLTAVNNINLSVNKGEFIAIIGPSGSGKSTLLHMIGGVDTPTSGKIFIEGVDISKYNSKELAIYRRRRQRRAEMPSSYK